MSSSLQFQLQPHIRLSAHSTLANNNLVNAEIMQGGPAVDALFDEFVEGGQDVLAKMDNTQAGLQFLGYVHPFAESQRRESGEVPELEDLLGMFREYQGEHPLTDVGSVAVQSAFTMAARRTEDGIVPREIKQGKGIGQRTVTDHGAIVYHAAQGDIVLGLPTSSVKDLFGLRNITAFVVPTLPLMNYASGVHRAEPEALKFFKFFVQSKLTEGALFVASPEVGRHLDVVMRNSYLGPQWEITDDEVALSYPMGKNTPGFPNLKEELAFWRNFPIDKLRRIESFDQRGVYTQGDVIVKDLGGGRYRIFEAGAYIGDVDTTESSPIPAFEERNRIEPNGEFQRLRKRILIDGEPALVPIKSGSLFTKEETSGIALFNNGRATLIDPPVDTIEWARANNIPLDIIDEVIVTHVHVDHMGGAARVLRHVPHRLRLTTDRIIFRQMMEMYHAMSLGTVRQSVFEEMWDFNPAMMKTPTRLANGLPVKIHQPFHSNTPIAITLFDRDASDAEAVEVVSFSGDTQMNPGVILALMDRRDKDTGRLIIRSAERAIDIMRQPVAAFLRGGLSMLDSGAMPLHNSEPVVAQLTAAYSVAKEKVLFVKGGQVYAYHTSPEAAEKEGLTYLGSGVEAAIMLGDRMGWHPSMARSTMDIAIDVLRRSDPYSQLPLEALPELKGHMALQQVEEGHVLMREGDEAGDLFFLLDGETVLSRNDIGDFLRLRSGPVGDRALAMDIRRTATVTTTKDTWVLRVDGGFAKGFLERHGIVAKIVKLADMQDQVVHLDSPLFADPTDVSRNALLLAADFESYSDGQHIIIEDDGSEDVFMVQRGQVKIWTREGRISNEPIVYEPGDPFGEMALVTGEPRSAMATAIGNVRVLRIPAGKMRRLARRYPGIALQLVALTADRLASDGAIVTSGRG